MKKTMKIATASVTALAALTIGLAGANAVDVVDQAKKDGGIAKAEVIDMTKVNDIKNDGKNDYNQYVYKMFSYMNNAFYPRIPGGVRPKVDNYKENPAKIIKMMQDAVPNRQGKVGEEAKTRDFQDNEKTPKASVINLVGDLEKIEADETSVAQLFSLVRVNGNLGANLSDAELKNQVGQVEVFYNDKNPLKMEDVVKELVKNGNNQQEGSDQFTIKALEEQLPNGKWAVVASPQVTLKPNAALLDLKGVDLLVPAYQQEKSTVYVLKDLVAKEEPKDDTKKEEKKDEVKGDSNKGQNDLLAKEEPKDDKKSDEKKVDVKKDETKKQEQGQGQATAVATSTPSADGKGEAGLNPNGSPENLAHTGSNTAIAGGLAALLALVGAGFGVVKRFILA